MSQEGRGRAETRHDRRVVVTKCATKPPFGPLRNFVNTKHASRFKPTDRLGTSEAPESMDGIGGAPVLCLFLIPGPPAAK